MVRPAEQMSGSFPVVGSDARLTGRRSECQKRVAGLETARSASCDRLECVTSASDSLIPLAFPHVVVMDDDLDVLDQLGHLLHQFSISVTMVSTVLDLQTLKRIAPDVIVLGLSGGLSLETRNALRQLRSDTRVSRIPVITSVGETGVRVKPRQETPQERAGQLPEPYDLDDIVATILGEITIQEFHHGIHHDD